jgi:hypothetical protein
MGLNQISAARAGVSFREADLWWVPEGAETVGRLESPHSLEGIVDEIDEIPQWEEDDITPYIRKDAYNTTFERIYLS